MAEQEDFDKDDPIYGFLFQEMPAELARVQRAPAEPEALKRALIGSVLPGMIKLGKLLYGRTGEIGAVLAEHDELLQDEGGSRLTAADAEVLRNCLLALQTLLAEASGEKVDELKKLAATGLEIVNNAGEAEEAEEGDDEGDAEPS